MDYDYYVIEIIKQMKYSGYIEFYVELLSCGFVWFDTGINEKLFDTNMFAEII